MFKIKDAWQIVEEVSTEGTWTDVRDGQVYPYKQFGNQIWMTVNFNYGGKQGDWVSNTTAQSAGHAWKYKNEQDYGNWESIGLYRGAFYKASSIPWVIPEGWHLPTRAEWATLLAWATAQYGDETKAKQALMAKTEYWNKTQTAFSWDDFGLAGFNIVPSGNGGGPDSGYVEWSNSEPSQNKSKFYTWAKNNASETTPSGFEIWYMESSSITKSYGGASQYSGYPIRLIKDSGVYVPQPAISKITTTIDSTGSDNKIATEKATRSAITSAVSSKMSNPMTAAGDLIVGGTSGAPSRLAQGTQGQVLKVGASGLEWANESGGGAVQSVSDTNSVDLSLDGNGDLTADLKIDTSTPGNVQLSVSSNGLKGSFDETVKALSGDNPVVVDYNSSDEYTVSLAVSRKAGNKVEIVDDQGQDSPGIYVPTPELDGVITTAGDLIIGNASGVPEALSAGAEGKVLKITSGVPAWGDDIGFANPMTNFGDIIFGGQVFSGTATPLRLGPGTIGQVLGLEAVSTFGMKPKWVDFPGTCQENFNICLSTKKENLTSNPNKLYAAKFISHETAKRTKLGFYHCTGIQGIVMMGIYDKLGNLIGQTGPCSFATEPDEEMLWYDVETPFTVTAGEEYWFVFWGGTAQGEYNMSLTVLQHDITQNFDPYIVGSISYTSSKTTLPSTIPSLQYETTLCYMAVK